MFSSFENVLGSSIYARLYPDWRRQQREVVEEACKDNEKFFVWVAGLDGIITGFIAYTLNSEEKTGEVYLLAVHPDYQNRRIGTELNDFVLGKMKESGIKLAVVGTGVKSESPHSPYVIQRPHIWFICLE